MSKRTTFTTITPIPKGISRDVVLRTLQDHYEMIDLNPLVIDRFPIPPPNKATIEELDATWYEIVDRIQYIPGTKGSALHYQGCFHNLADGLQTHVYAPMGLEIRGRWRIAGNVPGELAEPTELGLGDRIPNQGLYLREDVDMKCNFVMTGFVKKTLKKSHEKLVERIVENTKARTLSNNLNGTDSHGNRNRNNHQRHHPGGLMQPADAYNDGSAASITTPTPTITTTTTTTTASEGDRRAPPPSYLSVANHQDGNQYLPPMQQSSPLSFTFELPGDTAVNGNYQGTTELRSR